MLQIRWLRSALLVIALVTAMAGFSIYQFQQAAMRLEIANEVYVPVLKQISLLNGKWLAYQRWFEKTFAFKTWGQQSQEKLDSEGLVSLKKMIESNLYSLSSVLNQNQNFKNDNNNVTQLISNLDQYIQNEKWQLVELKTLLQNKQLVEAAQKYTIIKQAQSNLSHHFNTLNRDLEIKLFDMQLATQQELRKSIILLMMLFSCSVLMAYFVIHRVKRWSGPIEEWIGVAKDIAKNGIQKSIHFPKINRELPAELDILTREFSRMATTVLEREKTIKQQKEKLESLNSNLKSQMTELLATKEKLVHAEKLILAGNWSAQIAHEIRNPLNSISLQLEMLQEEVAEAELTKIPQRLQLVQEQIEWLDCLTKKYVEINQQPNSRLQFSQSSIDAVLEKALVFLNPEIMKHNITVEVAVGAKLENIRLDFEAMVQVFINLIKNAIDSLKNQTQKKLKIKVDLDLSTAMLMVQFNDSGGGIDQVSKAKLFEPFFTTKANGHGLGLSFSKQICLNHGGDLKLTEPLAGYKTAFVLTLPVNQNVKNITS